MRHALVMNPRIRVMGTAWHAPSNRDEMLVMYEKNPFSHLTLPFQVESELVTESSGSAVQSTKVQQRAHPDN